MRLDRPMLVTMAAALCGATRPDAAFAQMRGSDVDTEAECRWCHCERPGDLYLPNRHHTKVGQPVPGSTAGETYNCLTATCHQMRWNAQISAYELANFRDCIPCHGSHPNPGHHQPARYACGECHETKVIEGCNQMVLVNWCGRPRPPSGRRTGSRAATVFPGPTSSGSSPPTSPPAPEAAGSRSSPSSRRSP